MQSGMSERRREARKRCSCHLWWRCDDDRPYRSGWMVDRSQSGAAFLMRTASVPRVGEPIQAVASESTATGGVLRGVVRRVSPVHSGLVLVAAEFFTKRAGPMARAIEREVKPETLPVAA